MIDHEAPMMFACVVDNILYESNYFEAIHLAALWTAQNLDPEGKPPMKG